MKTSKSPAKVAPVLDDRELEFRLRDALSKAAPPGLPTIGVRERIVCGVRERRARRQRLAGALAATLLVVAGASVGAVALHSSSNGKTTSAAAPLVTSPKLPVPRANCGEIAVDASVVAGCYGVFGKSPTTNSTYGSEQPAFAEPNAHKNFKGNKAGGDQGSGGYEVVVPVGRPVTVVLPGSAGEIWTAPAVVPGQGTDASRVLAISAHVAGAGKGSSATFESTVAVTVVIDASSLAACGEQQTACGMPTSFWSVVLEFRAS